MSITGVGSQYTYMYDAATNKLLTKDGSADIFCDFFNGGDLAEKCTRHLRHTSAP